MADTKICYESMQFGFKAFSVPLFKWDFFLHVALEAVMISSAARFHNKWAFTVKLVVEVFG